MAFKSKYDAFYQSANDQLIKVSHTVIVFIDISNSQKIVYVYGQRKAYAMVYDLFHQLQAVCLSFGLSVIKTNGDQIVLASQSPNGASASVHGSSQSVHAAYGFASTAHQAAVEKSTDYGCSIKLRVGIALGDVFFCKAVTGRSKSDVWGNTVNKAAMLEQYTLPGSTALCASAFDALPSPCKKFCSNHTFDTKCGKLDAFIVVRPLSKTEFIKPRKFKFHRYVYSNNAAITREGGGNTRSFH